MFYCAPQRGIQGSYPPAKGISTQFMGLPSEQESPAGFPGQQRSLHSPIDTDLASCLAQGKAEGVA